MSGTHMKLGVMRLGTALGLTSAIGMFVLGLSAYYLGHGAEMVQFIGTFYHGYSASLTGSLWGALWGFVDGFVGGVLIAWFYNCCCKQCKTE